ncbi:MAG: hypothetical protein UY44_C0019G0010, partial [Candidatus Kaiserbacteria bacterium GW2011_GWA2_49_19]
MRNMRNMRATDLINRLPSCFARAGAASCALGLIFALGLYASPQTAKAQDAIVTSEPTFRAEHAGKSIYNGNPVNIFLAPEIATIHSSELVAVDGSWIIEETQPWGRDVPLERGIFILKRMNPEKVGFLAALSEDSFEGGTAVRGKNYDFAHVSFSASATTTHAISFSLPYLGAAGVPSGLYGLFVAEVPATKLTSDPETGDGTTSEFTDEDMEKILAGDPSYAYVYAPIRYSFPAGFNYINDGPPPCAKDCFSNVLFLPGIESSRLYRAQVVGNEEKKLWEPGVNDELRDLWLTTEGESIRDVYTKENDVVDELPVVGKNIYKSLISKMDEMKTQEKIKDWKAIPYDWRLSLDDVLSYGNNVGGKIYYSGNNRATSTPYIIQELRRLAKNSKSKKVTVIAHSNGGLVAKRLTEILGDEASQLIDKMILVAVPQVGTPMAIAAGLHGYDQAHLGGLITDEEDARTFSSTTPMIYNLMPSAGYLAQVKDAVVKFEISLALSDWIDNYGNLIRSENELRDFLTGYFGKVDAKTGDIDQPIKMNYSMLTDAEEIHAMLDAWTPPDGISLIQIAGWGVPKTV